MRRLLTLAALSALFLLAFGGVAFAEAGVSITDDGLDPERVRVDIREAIVWTNATDGDVSLVGEDPTWESGPIEPGATFSIEITQNGTYRYASEDGDLEGEIVVGAADDDQNGDGDGNGGEQDNNDDDDEPVDEVDPEDERMPETGSDAALSGVLSVLLIGFGGGLLRVTQPRRRL